MLREGGVTETEDVPQTVASGVIEDIRSAVMDGNSYYFLRLEGSDTYYSLSAAQNPIAVILNVGDTVTIQHAAPVEGGDNSILDGSSVTLDAAAPEVTPEPDTEPSVIASPPVTETE